MLRARKLLKGGEAVSKAEAKEAIDGLGPKSRPLMMVQVSWPTGAMTKKLRMMAKPFMTMAGGTCWTPKAFLTKVGTTTILT